MASAQWKNFQPSSQQEGTMLPYQRSSSFNSKSSSHNANNSSTGSSPTHSGGVIREAGIIEKLLHSYGFIQCCEKQARLFFHFSQFHGNIEHLKVGDAVEFETSYDHKTGKPVARSISKIESEALSEDILIEERVSGVVVTEIKTGEEGRIAYSNRGEVFFLPYSTEDVEGNEVKLMSGDVVAFHIDTDKDTGNHRATNVSLKEKAQRDKHQGVVCTLKETYGFIERADVVREIFFHASECKDFKSMSLGDDVEFGIQNRNNKEVATNVSRLPIGTVVFEDISPEYVNGQIIKTLDRYQNRQNGDPLPGRIRYRRENKESEIQYGDKDTRGEYILQVGDWVQFNMAVDRRDNLQKATNIELLADESFLVSCEKREQGIVAAVKDSYGFIKCSDRDSRLYFRFTEILDGNATIQVQDEVEFTVTQDPSSPSRSHATRIKILPPGTINFFPSSGCPGDRQVGVIDKEAQGFWSSKGSSNRDRSTTNGEIESDGTIVYQCAGEEKAVPYALHDCDTRNPPKMGEKVEFGLREKGGSEVAVDIKSVGGHHGFRNGFRYSHRGFVAALKESYGFIETEEHDREIFFHFSTYDGNLDTLELGQQVVYGISNKSAKVSAECVRKLPKGTIPAEEARPEVLSGVVLRPVRCFNPEQEEYAGLVAVTSEDGDTEEEYPFGITSLCDKHDFLQKDDCVQFQIGVGKEGVERAVNVRAVRTQLQATVEAIKGNFGFLSHEVEEGKKLFFHMSEVKEGVGLQPGDRVEFILMHNQRTGKHSACNVVKIGDGQPSQRPERLVSRLRTMSVDDSGPRMVVVRQPRGPDGSRGFKRQRYNEAAGDCYEEMHEEEPKDDYEAEESSPSDDPVSS